MVTLSEIYLSYGGQVILNGINLTINQGARIALYGANGSGKSSLMRIISGLMQADGGNVNKSRGVEISYLSQSGVNHRDHTLYEELSLAFAPQITVENKLRQVEEQMAFTDNSDELEKLLDSYGELLDEIGSDDASQRTARLKRVSQGLGFSEDDADRDITTFSSGWQMRIQLAKVLLQNPDLMLLDEPSNYLDLKARQWLEDYLRSYPGSFVLVAHDRTLMDRTCDQVVEIFRGQLHTYSVIFSEYLKSRTIELKQMAEAYERQQEDIARMEIFIRKFRANSSKARLVQSRVKQLSRMPRLHPPPVQSHIVFHFAEAPRAGPRVLSVSGLGLLYGSHRVIRGLDMEVKRGERLALVGENGVGKSTLMRGLAATIPAAEGKITLGARTVVGYYSQENVENLTGSQSVIESLEAIAPTMMIPRLRNILGAFLFSGDDVFKPLEVLSGGERSRVALVRLLLQPTNLLLLDEPTSHLDLSAISVLSQALREYTGTLLFTSHDEYFIEQLATRVMEISRDQICHYYGDWDYYQYKKSTAISATLESSLRENSRNNRKHKRESSNDSNRSAIKIERRQQVLLEELDQLQKAEEKLQNQLSDPIIYSDGVRVRELTLELRANAVLQQQTNTKWEKIENDQHISGDETHESL